MKIRMKDAGESPDFGAFQAGDEIDDSRASIETLRLLVDRGLAEDISDSELRTPKRRTQKED